MSNNGESLPFGIFSPKDLSVATSSGRANSASGKQNADNKQEFASLLSKSVADAANATRRPVRKTTAGTPGKQNVHAASKGRQSVSHRSATAHGVPGNKHSVHKPDNAANARRTSSDSGKKLPQNRSGETDQRGKLQAGSAASRERATSQHTLKTSRREKDKNLQDDVNNHNGETNNAESKAANAYDKAGFQDAPSSTADSGYGEIAAPSVESGAPNAEHSDFAALEPVTQDNTNLSPAAASPETPTVSSEWQAQTAATSDPSAQSSNSLASPTSSLTSSLTSPQTSPLNRFADQTNALTGNGGTGVSDYTDESIPGQDTTTPGTNGVNNGESAKTSAVEASKETLIGAVNDNTNKTALTGMDKAVRSLNDAMQLASHSFNKHSASQSATNMMAGNISGQHAGDNSGDGQQSLKQDPSMFRDRIYTLVQQAGTNQGLSTHQDFNKLALQQAAAVDPIDGEQRAGEVNLNPAREPSLAGRIPGGPLQMFSPALQMSSAFSQNGWSSELGQKVMWLARADLQQAQLQLNPKHLGPLEIKITMNADQQINVNFLTHSAAVKDALDQATPRLREVFDQSGLNLADVNVQQESNKQNREQSQSNPQPSHGTSYLAENVHEDLSAPLGTHGSVLSTNIVDFYA